MKAAHRNTGNKWNISDEKIEGKFVEITEAGEIKLKLNHCRMTSEDAEYTGEVTLDIEEVYVLLGQLERQKFNLLAKKANKPPEPFKNLLKAKIK